MSHFFVCVWRHEKAENMDKYLIVTKKGKLEDYSENVESVATKNAPDDGKMESEQKHNSIKS